MAQPHDDFFAKHCIQLKLLTPAQVMACRDIQAELESAGVQKLLAIVAVDQALISRGNAEKLVASINTRFPGKHPALPPVESMPVTRPAPGTDEPPPVPSGKLEAAPKPKTAAPLRKPVGAPSQAVSDVVPAARRGPSGTRPAARPAAPPKSGSKMFLIVGGIAAVAVVAAVAFFALGGEKKKNPPADTAKVTPPPVVEPAKPPPPKPEEAKPEPKPEPKPESKPEPKPEPKPAPSPSDTASKAAAQDLKKEFDERLAERKKEAQARLEEVRKELAQEKKEADLLLEATRKRLSGKKVNVALLSGETHKDAVIKGFTFHGADLDVAGKDTRLTWDTVQPASLITLAESMFDPQRAQDQFDRGRFFVSRRMWKEAQGAFGAAAKLGQGFESRVLEFSEVLDRLVSGQGGFRGSARRIGRDSVHLSWDFHDAKQLEDFTGGLTLSGKSATLDSPRKISVYFSGGTSSGSDESPLAFVGQLTANLKLSCDGPVTFHLFAGPAGGYEIDFGPAGAQLFKIDPKAAEKDRRKQIAKAEKVKMTAGKTCDISVGVRYPKFTLLVDRAEALAFDDGPVSVTAEPPKGAFGFGIAKGKLKLEAPLELEGRAEPAELDRRINDTEVMVRRALDPDLEQIERFRTRRKAMAVLGEARDLSFSSDDPYFAFRVKKFEDITRYEELKKNIGGIPDKQTPEQWKTEMDGMIARYPDVPSLYQVRALFKHEHQDNIGALADVKKAVELFPDFHEALALQATIHLQQQDPELALESIRRALDARPDYVEGYVIRAQCVYATSLSMQGFMDDLDIARRLDPQDSHAVTVQRSLKYQRLGPRELGCRFDYETAHYRVTTDISAEASKRYGENLEAAHRHYTQAFKVSALRTGRGKPRVAIFNTAENYYTYFELLSEDRGENTLGVFWPGLNELVLFEKSSDLADTNHTLYHEAVHQFMTLMTNRTPPYWYNEGIAEYMGSIKVQDGKVLEKGLVLHERLPYAQLAIEVKADLAFDKIMNETPGEFYSGNVGLKYAQAWSMIHFFYEFEKGKYRPLIEDYFDQLRAGKTPRQCYDAVFKAKEEALQKEWREFTKGLK